MNEDAEVGTGVGITVSISDPNDEVLTYGLIDNADGLFTIDPTTGVVSVAAGLDFETTTEHTIIAEVTDGTTAVSAPFVIMLTGQRSNCFPGLIYPWR